MGHPFQWKAQTSGPPKYITSVFSFFFPQRRWWFSLRSDHLLLWLCKNLWSAALLERWSCSISLTWSWTIMTFVQYISSICDVTGRTHQPNSRKTSYDVEFLSYIWRTCYSCFGCKQLYFQQCNGSGYWMRIRTKRQGYNGHCLGISGNDLPLYMDCCVLKHPTSWRFQL